MPRPQLVCLGLVFSMVLGACAPANTAPPPSIPPPSTDSRRPDLSPGSPLLVRRGPLWLPARVVGPAGPDRVVVQFEGYGPEWNEAVPFDRVRARPLGALPRDYRVGDRVLVLAASNKLFAAEIVQQIAPARFRVHYDGYGPEVAEDVGPDRLRRFLEPLPSTPAPPPPPEPLALAPGAEVFVGHRGAYHRAIVVAAGTDGMIRVRYAAPSDGVAEESVPSSRVRPAPPPSSPPFQPDQKVFVEWHGMFFPGRILRASGKGMYRVRFDGVGSDADEDVPVRRLRAAP